MAAGGSLGGTLAGDRPSPGCLGRPGAPRRLERSFFCQRDVLRLDSRRRPRGAEHSPAGRWLPRARQVAELQGFLAKIDAIVPAGEAIAFHSDAAEDQRLYVYLWAAYLLPERDLLPLSRSDWHRRTAFVAVYGAAPATPADTGLELVERFEQGALLRRKR